jgi:hypothetical protein
MGEQCLSELTLVVMLIEDKRKYFWRVLEVNCVTLTDRTPKI